MTELGETRCGLCGAILPSHESQIRAAVQAEREACAKVAESHVKLRPLEELKPNREVSDVTWARRQIAAAIRARSDIDALEIG